MHVCTPALILTFMYLYMDVNLLRAKRSYIYIGVHTNAKEQLFKHKNVYKHINETFKTYAAHACKFLSFRMYVSLARPLCNRSRNTCNRNTSQIFPKTIQNMDMHSFDRQVSISTNIPPSKALSCSAQYWLDNFEN